MLARSAANGDLVYSFLPSPSMRTFGLRAETLGRDYDHAVAVVEKYNTEWETTKERPNKIINGDIAWLIHQFEKDPT